MHFIRAAIATALALGAASAHAQSVGNYVGTLPDGNGITITVAYDDNNLLAVTGISYGLSTICKNGSTFGTGWGIGVDSPINNGTVSITFLDPYIDTGASLKFNGAGVNGKIQSATPEMLQPNGFPTGATLCTEASQSFTAQFSATPSLAAPAKGTATHYNR